MLEPNSSFLLVDATTGEVLGEDFFYDPFIAWAWSKQHQCWYVARGYGGNVLESWWQANPRPTHRPAP